jgi:hypothetical protein
MALVTLMSASGSPGVTTAALGLALTWPRPVLLVEADPTGGSAVLAGYLRGAATPPESLIDLAVAHREGRLADTLPQVTMPLPGSGVRLLPGIRSHAQAASLTGLWEPLAAVLAGLERTGQDVIVDAGRLGLAGSPQPLVAAADLALLVTRSDLVALSGARSWAKTLREDAQRLGALDGLGVLLVGEGRPYRAREVAKVLGVPVTASVAWDPAVAGVLAHGHDLPPSGLVARSLGRAGAAGSPLLRSLTASGAVVQHRVEQRRARLGAAPDPRLDTPPLQQPSPVGGWSA